MKITILVENKKTERFPTEHGLSLYIENGRKILFDAGSSDTFVKNAQTLGIWLHELDYVVLSHGHYDHGNGLNHLSFDTLLCHPDCFVGNYQKKDGIYCGIDGDLNAIRTDVNLIEAKTPYAISDQMVFLGEIPRTNLFESRHTHFTDALGRDSFVPDDSALAVMTQQGLVIITGCSHSGICNICEYAKRITGMRKIHMLIGGFHLHDQDIVLEKTIRYLSGQNIDRLYPIHCVSNDVMTILSRELDAELIFTGNTICVD